MVTWEEQRLFVESFEVIHLALNDTFVDGWMVSGNGRRRGASWNPLDRTLYDRLSRLEALDVAEAELVRLLEL